MNWCYIRWTKGNIYGILVVRKTRQMADEDRMTHGRQGYEVSALAEIQDVEDGKK